MPEAHGTEEITCMGFSKTGRKLYTGARNGSVKVNISEFHFKDVGYIGDYDNVQSTSLL